MSKGNTLGESLKSARQDRKISAAAIAKIIETKEFPLNENNIYKWERGSIPTNPVIYKNLLDWIASPEAGKTPTENGKTNENTPSPAHTISVEEFIESIREQKRMAENHNRDLKEILVAHLANIEGKLTRVDANLGDALLGVTQQALRMEAMGYTALEALSLLSGKKPDHLAKESDKRQTEAAKKIYGQGKKIESHK